MLENVWFREIASQLASWLKNPEPFKLLPDKTTNW